MPAGDPYAEVYRSLDEPPENDDEETEEDEAEEEDEEDGVEVADEDEEPDEDGDASPVAGLLEADGERQSPPPPRVMVCDSAWGPLSLVQNIGRLPRSERVAHLLATDLERLRVAAKVAQGSPGKLSVADLAREMNKDKTLTGGFNALVQSVARFIDRGDRVELADKVVSLAELLVEGRRGPRRGEEREQLQGYLARLRPGDRADKTHPELAEMFVNAMVHRGHHEYTDVRETKIRSLARMIGRILESLRPGGPGRRSKARAGPSGRPHGQPRQAEARKPGGGRRERSVRRNGRRGPR